MNDKTIKQMPVMGFPLPKLKPEGRTICQWDCQYEELNKRNKELEAALLKITKMTPDPEFGTLPIEAAIKVARAALGEKKDV